jgi:DNA-binding GntR family transcriptional regulator
LESAGVIETRGRHGTFVANSVDPVRHEAESAAAQFADQMRRLQVSTTDALRLVVAALPPDPADAADPGK